MLPVKQVSSMWLSPRWNSALMVMRWLLAALAAVSVATLLFSAMNWVILASDTLKLEDSTRKIIDFVQVKTDQQLLKTERAKPEKPQPPQSVPLPQLVPDFDLDTATLTGSALNFAPVDLGNTLDIAGGIALGPVEDNAEYLPLVKVQPQYPTAAASRGIEGYVIVEYTVTAKGTTKDWRVIEANPANVFERAALAAARRFKYNPKLVDGQPVEVPGVRNRFNFRLQK